MIRSGKKLFKKILPGFIQDKIAHRDEYLRISSILHAVKGQGLLDLYNRLGLIVPDIENQYSSFKVDTDYYRTKIRAHHSFQISMVQDALKLLNLKNHETLKVVDIGDSCGTHLQYIKHLYGNIDALSVNIDPEAVRRIKEKGMKAICTRAEDLGKYSIKADICLSFQVLEHLFDPIGVLRKFSKGMQCKAFIVTVPYLRQSKVALNHIRNNQRNNFFAENVHVFELSPTDWQLIFQHSGWRVMHEKIYLQYPKKGLLKFTRQYWKRVDYEGFYGAVLLKDSTWSDLYKDWQK